MGGFVLSRIRRKRILLGLSDALIKKSRWKSLVATILTPIVIRPRQRRCYSQSRRSSEFPCGAHARHFPVFPSCSHRDASRSRGRCSAARTPAPSNGGPRRPSWEALSYAIVEKGSARGGRRAWTLHAVLHCDIRLFYISLVRWVITSHVDARAVPRGTRPRGNPSARYAVDMAWRAGPWKRVKWRVFSSRERDVQLGLARRRRDSTARYRISSSRSAAGTWRRANFPTRSDVAFAISVPLYRRDARARGIQSGASQRNFGIGSIAVVFRRELSTRRHFVPGPTSPDRHIAFHVSALHSSSPFAGREVAAAAAAAAARVATKWFLSLLAPSSPLPPTSSNASHDFFSRPPYLGACAGGTRSGKICQQFVFVSCAHSYAHAHACRASPDVTRSRARNNNINRLRNRTQRPRNETLHFFRSLSLSRALSIYLSVLAQHLATAHLAPVFLLRVR